MKERIIDTWVQDNELFRYEISPENVPAARERVKSFLTPERLQAFLQTEEAKDVPEGITVEKLIALAQSKIVIDAFANECIKGVRYYRVAGSPITEPPKAYEDLEIIPLVIYASTLTQAKLDFELSPVTQEQLEKAQREYSWYQVHLCKENLENLHAILKKTYPPFSLSEEEIQGAVGAYELLGKFMRKIIEEVRTSPGKSSS